MWWTEKVLLSPALLPLMLVSIIGFFSHLIIRLIRSNKMGLPCSICTFSSLFSSPQLPVKQLLIQGPCQVWPKLCLTLKTTIFTARAKAALKSRSTAMEQEEKISQKKYVLTQYWYYKALTSQNVEGFLSWFKGEISVFKTSVKRHVGEIRGFPVSGVFKIIWATFKKRTKTVYQVDFLPVHLPLQVISDHVSLTAWSKSQFYWTQDFPLKRMGQILPCEAYHTSLIDINESCSSIHLLADYG